MHAVMYGTYSTYWGGEGGGDATHVRKYTRLSLRYSEVQWSYIKIVRGEGEPGDEATMAPHELF